MQQEGSEQAPLHCNWPLGGALLFNLAWLMRIWFSLSRAEGKFLAPLLLALVFHGMH